MRGMGQKRRISGARVRDFARAEGGNVAMLWALCGAALIGLTGLTVDFTRAQSLRNQVQNAADGAVLVAERSSNLSLEDRTAAARAFFDAELGDLAEGAAFEVIPLEGGGHRVEARYTMPLSLARIIKNEDWTIGVASEAMSQPSPNYEVALVLDITGSMSGQKIIDLREAANALIEEVVHEEQTPYYTRVALAPYSSAVNVGDYAAQVRGPVTAGKTISTVTRSGSTITVNATSHGFSTGQYVSFTGVSGVTQLNNTATNKAWRVTRINANRFTVSGSSSGSSSGSGGKAFCTTAGCEYYRFTNDNGGGQERVHRISTCVSERTGANAFTAAAPSTTLLGRNYPSSANPCTTAQITPLTSDTNLLANNIDDLEDEGSTAGHLGIAWGWYLLSPSFGSLFSGEGVPGAYNDDEVVKIAVLMTDGFFNTVYCNGVISGPTSTSGSGSDSDKINCASPNGDSFEQAEELCDGMKQAGIEIYTVAFGLSGVSGADDVEELMANCATDAEHAKSADDGGELIEVFRSIGTAIGQLRITR